MASNFDNGCMFGKNDMKKGKDGEYVVSLLYEAFGWTANDVSDDFNFRKVDIDFVMEKDDYQLYVEAKYQKGCHEGQICLEHMLDVDKGMSGWIWYTQADVVAIANWKKILLFDRQELQEFLTYSIEGKKGYYSKPAYQIDTKEQNKYYAGRKAEIRWINVNSYRRLGYSVQEYDIKVTDGKIDYKEIISMEQNAWKE